MVQWFDNPIHVDRRGRMGIHRNAALTVRQRQELQRLRREEGWTIARLATHFRVNRSTVFR